MPVDCVDVIGRGRGCTAVVPPEGFFLDPCEGAVALDQYAESPSPFDEYSTGKFHLGGDVMEYPIRGDAANHDCGDISQAAFLIGDDVASECLLGHEAASLLVFEAFGRAFVMAFRVAEVDDVPAAPNAAVGPEAVAKDLCVPVRRQNH
jgi:hypothetical protein